MYMLWLRSEPTYCISIVILAVKCYGSPCNLELYRHLGVLNNRYGLVIRLLKYRLVQRCPGQCQTSPRCLVKCKFDSAIRSDSAQLSNRMTQHSTGQSSIESALYRTELNLNQQSTGQSSIRISTLQDRAQFDSALYRTELNLNQHSTAQSSIWISTLQDRAPFDLEEQHPSLCFV